jgi:hypothetical protein
VLVLASQRRLERALEQLGDVDLGEPASDRGVELVGNPDVDSRHGNHLACV